MRRGGLIALGVILGAAALAWLAFASREAAPVEASLSVVETLGVGDTAGFDRAQTPIDFEWPRDHGPHPGFRNEWWYFTGTLSARGEQRRFGFQLTWFRSAVRPEPPAVASAWATNQVWMAHFALTDESGGRFHAADAFARGAAGQAGATAHPLRVWLRNWELASVATGAPADDWRGVFPLTVRAGGDGATLALTLDRPERIVFQGANGLDPKGPEPGNASYYFSLPRMAARGTVVLAEDTIEVEGEAWLDREWSTSALGPGIVGWDWFAMRLDDDSELMLYRLRRDDGSAGPFSNGIAIAADGTETRLDAADFDIRSTRTWTSRRTGVTYPVAWRIDVPRLDLALDLDAWLDAQELDLAFRYWEGAVDVRGTGPNGPLRGTGYVELTGYDRRSADGVVRGGRGD